MRLNLPTIFVFILALSSFAAAQSPEVVSANTAPWIPLFVIAVVRAALCLGNGGALQD